MVWVVTTTPIPAATDTLQGLSDVALLDVAERALQRLATQPLSAAVDDDTLNDSVRRLQRVESRVHAEKLRRLHAVAERETFRADSERSAADWAKSQLGLAAHDAGRQVRTAAVLGRLPATRDALAAGALTPGHAAAAARGVAVLDDGAHHAQIQAHGDPAACDAIDADHAAAVVELDAFISQQPATVDPTELGRRIEAWTISRQPASIQSRTKWALRRRGLRWLPHRDADGLHTAIVKTTDDGKAQIDAAVGALARKTSVEDQRSLVQRQHDALVTLCQQACDRGELPAVAAQRTHVLMISSPAAQAGDPDAPAAWLDGVGPVSSDTAQLIACDADTTDIVWDTDRGVWVIGRADGDPSPVQRQIVLARDKVCVGCGAPASRCQIHHIIWRSKHGRTVVENLVLVCWSCHHGLHHLGWTVTQDAAGRFALHKRRAG